MIWITKYRHNKIVEQYKESISDLMSSNMKTIVAELKVADDLHPLDDSHMKALIRNPANHIKVYEGD